MFPSAGSELLPQRSCAIRRYMTRVTGPATSAKEVRELLNSPIVSLLGARVRSAGGNMITEGVKDKLLAAAGRGRHSRDSRDLRTYSKCKERLPETGRPCFIPAVSPYHTEPGHRFVPKYTVGECSSWGSRSSISVRSTESNAVATMRCGLRRRSCSARHESAKACWSTWNGRLCLTI